MMFEIKQVQLKELLSEPTRNGLTKPKAIRGQGVPMIAMGEVFANNRIYSIQMERVPVTDKELITSSIYDNDLLFARQSLVLEGAGKCCIVKKVNEPTVFESHLIRVRVDKTKALPDYIYYYFNSYQGRENIKTIVEQVAAAGIRGSDLVNLYIPIPPVTVQQQIVQVLMNIDDKIAVNTAINENLEQQAQALFKNLIADVQERVPFTSVIQVLGGGTPKTGKQEYWNGEIPFFTPKDVGTPYVLTTEKNITPLGLDNCNSRLYPVNTVFLTARGTVGKVSLAGVPMSMNQSCYALAGKDGLHQIIVYHYVLETVKALKHKASGAVFDAIITRDFDTESVPALSSEQIDSFIAVAEPIYSDIFNRTIENQRLAALRDTLLPKLMNGEIDVSEVKI